VTVVAMDVSADAAELADGVDGQLVRDLVDRARADGVKLTGEGGLLSQLTKIVIESALEGEMDHHLGYGKHDPAGRKWRELAKWDTVENGGDRGRAGGGRGTSGPGLDVRATHRGQTPAAVVRGR